MSDGEQDILFIEPIALAAVVASWVFITVSVLALWWLT